MMLMLSGSEQRFQGRDPDRYGVLQIPDCVIPEANHGRVWCGDNQCFKGFDKDKFKEMLGKLHGMQGCKFIAAPDIIYDAFATLQIFPGWASYIRSAGFPVALVAQDGLTADQVPWYRIDSIFIGGTDKYKESDEVLKILESAPAGIWRHVGRVNTRRRMKHFWGRVDSVDGSGFSRYPSRVDLFDKWYEELAAGPQPAIF